MPWFCPYCTLSPACHWHFLCLLQVVIAKVLKYQFIMPSSLQVLKQLSNIQRSQMDVLIIVVALANQTGAWGLTPLCIVLSHHPHSWRAEGHAPQGQSLPSWAHCIEEATADRRMCASIRPSSPREGATESIKGWKTHLQIPPISAYTPLCPAPIKTWSLFVSLFSIKSQPHLGLALANQR